MNKLTLSHDWPLLLAILVLLFFVYMSNKQPGFKFACYILLAGAILLMLFGCSSTKSGQCKPSKKSQDYAVRSWWKQRSDGYWLHYRQSGFKDQTVYIFECKPNCEQLERFYDSVSKVKY